MKWVLLFILMSSVFLVQGYNGQAKYKVMLMVLFIESYFLQPIFHKM